MIKRLIKNKKAEGFVDTGVKILIAIVIGALLLGGIYALAKDTILPTTQTKVESMFDYTPVVKPKVITFYIDHKEYHAEEGMTWVDWLDSEYNVLNYRDIGGRVGKSSYVYLEYQKGYKAVSKTEEIPDGCYYIEEIETPIIFF